MALSEKSRSSLYLGLTAVIDDQEAVSDMLAHFPAREVDETVTKDHLRAEMTGLRAELRGEMADLRAELRGEMADLRAELRGEMADLRAELKTDIAGLDTKMTEGFAHVSAEVSAEMRRWFLANVALMLTLAAAVVALVRTGGG